MNTLLIIFVLYNTTFVPKFAVNYETEQQCNDRVHDFGIIPSRHRRAVCIQANIQLEPAPVITELTAEQIDALGVREFNYVNRSRLR